MNLNYLIKLQILIDQSSFKVVCDSSTWQTKVVFVWKCQVDYMNFEKVRKR